MRKSVQYYRFFNADECHHKFQYKNGLNIDTENFNSNPENLCAKGGLYFTTPKFLIEFLQINYKYVREVSVPEEYTKLKLNNNKYRSHALYLKERHNLDKVETWQWMNARGIIFDERAMIWAVWNANCSVVEYLYTTGNFDATKCFTGCSFVEYACQYGYLKMVKLLTECGADVSKYALHNALQHNHINVVKYLCSLKEVKTDTINEILSNYISMRAYHILDKNAKELLDKKILYLKGVIKRRKKDEETNAT